MQRMMSDFKSHLAHERKIEAEEGRRLQRQLVYEQKQRRAKLETAFFDIEINDEIMADV